MNDHADERIYAATGEDGKVMKAPERDHKRVFAANAEGVNASEMLVVTPGEKQNGESGTPGSLKEKEGEPTRWATAAYQA